MFVTCARGRAQVLCEKALMIMHQSKYTGQELALLLCTLGSIWLAVNDFGAGHRCFQEALQLQVREGLGSRALGLGFWGVRQVLGLV